jgi:hypothetical protein
MYIEVPVETVLAVEQPKAEEKLAEANDSDSSSSDDLDFQCPIEPQQRRRRRQQRRPRLPVSTSQPLPTSQPRSREPAGVRREAASDIAFKRRRKCG